MAQQRREHVEECAGDRVRCAVLLVQEKCAKKFATNLTPNETKKQEDARIFLESLWHGGWRGLKSAEGTMAEA